jgi:hypothetical protein
MVVEETSSRKKFHTTVNTNSFSFFNTFSSRDFACSKEASATFWYGVKINSEFCALCVVVFVWHVLKKLQITLDTDRSVLLAATDVVISFS